MYLLTKWEGWLEKYLARGHAALGPYAMTSSQIFSHPARANLVNKYIFRPARANAYGVHTGLSPMVLQRKRFQDRTGHMIRYVVTFF